LLNGDGAVAPDGAVYAAVVVEADGDGVCDAD
jgi:hypothetical protein